MALAPHQPSVPASLVPQFIEQYKAYLRDLGNIGSRQAQTTTWYVSILSALMVFISYLAQSSNLHLFASASIAVSALVDISLCVLWHFHVRSYQYLYNAKFGVLREMEQTKIAETEPTLEGSPSPDVQRAALPFACYTLENAIMDPKRIRFTDIEKRLSLVLIFPFLVVFVLAVLNCASVPELW